MRTIKTKIVGVTFQNPNGRERQQLLLMLQNKMNQNPNHIILLRRDNKNPHDKNAVAVFNIQGDQLGFLSRNVAKTIAPLMDKGTYISIKALQVTGGESRYLGLNVELEYLEKQLAATPF